MGKGGVVIALLVLAGMVKAAVAWAIFGLPTLDPDTFLYAQGGLGLFPSPLGRLVGIGGPVALGVFNVAANGLLVYAVVRLAGRSSRAPSSRRRPALAGALVVVSPLGVWSVFAGVDTIAAALLVLARSSSRRTSSILDAGAIGFHYVALIVVVLLRVRPSRRSLLATFAACGLGVMLALVTPFAPVLTDADPLVIVSSSIATAAVFALTFLPFLHRLGAAVPAIAGGALAAGLQAGVAWETNCRYLLPAVALGAAHSVRGAA